MSASTSFPENRGFHTDPSASTHLAMIKVVGVGGGGVNSIDRMVESNVSSVEFIAINTDAQALMLSQADVRIGIGQQLTRGLGAGAVPEIGRQAAEEDRGDIEEALKGADMVFIAVGEGGGTGTGAAPIVAESARSMGALTVAVVSKPFSFEGKRRMRNAEAGIAALRECCDALIVIPNQRLLEVLDKSATREEAFRYADQVMRDGVDGITKILTTPGQVNVDFADVRAILKDAGTALMGVGEAVGENAAEEAARNALNSALLERSMHGATGVLSLIAGGDKLSLHDVASANEFIQEQTDEDANYIFGSVTDDSLGDTVRVTVIATGFPADIPQQSPRQPVVEVEQSRPESGSDAPDDYQGGGETLSHNESAVPVLGEVSTPQTRTFVPPTSVPSPSAGKRTSSSDKLSIPDFIRRQ